MQTGGVDEPQRVYGAQQTTGQGNGAVSRNIGRVFAVFAQFPQVQRGNKISGQYHDAGDAQHHVPGVMSEIDQNHGKLHEYAGHPERNGRGTGGVCPGEQLGEGAVLPRGKGHFCRNQSPGQPAGQYRDEQTNVHEPCAPVAYGPFQNTGRGRCGHTREFSLGHEAERQDGEQRIDDQAAEEAHDCGPSYVLRRPGTGGEHYGAFDADKGP